MKELARSAGNVLGRVSGRVSNLVKVLGSVVVVGSPVYMGGCEVLDTSPDGTLFMSWVTGGLAVTEDNPKKAGVYGVTSDSLRTAAQIQAQKDAARIGKTEIHIYNGSDGSGGNGEGDIYIQTYDGLMKVPKDRLPG